MATGGSEFGLLDQTPILQNPMCHGNESDLTECPGYHLNNVVGGNCLNGNDQAGFRCIKSKNLVCLYKVAMPQCISTLYDRADYSLQL